MTPLEKKMVLHRFMCDQFGYPDLRKLLGIFAHLPEAPGKDAPARFGIVLSEHTPHYPTGATREDIARYDANIAAISEAMRMTHDTDRGTWKPFQYLALLFTERYLDLYFTDPEALVDKLNQWQKEDQRTDTPNPYTVDDLRTIAYQSATGSGKTLLLHANILQYRHYMEKYGQLSMLNKIILVTPDEGLSRQHLRELQKSRINARLFSDDDGGVLSRGGVSVDIIDLHKLDEKKGIKRVALESFEENNLVLVDEGHLGSGGKVWRKRRKQLARGGFTFEYSATFNQAVGGNKELRDEYGKSILFDYSYKFFYEDGYGKDYKISNMQDTTDEEANNAYLLACLLTFYQQCRLYRDKGGQWLEFNLAAPLWVFLGRTVTGGTSKPLQQTESDVVRIVQFLAWVQSERAPVERGIARLLSDDTGLVDQSGADIFRGAFAYIQGNTPQQTYDNLCSAVFHGAGQLCIHHLSSSDELQLRSGDALPHGVINVGDAAGLFAKLQAVKNPGFTLAKDIIAEPLFDKVDTDHSPVNIVIGARKFVAGWNSWRVSTMGLMHVGAGEGPQIIQMFGRGIRLKGHGMSLKRHTALEGVAADDSEHLGQIETLNIFGLKANYMEKFKDYLQREGISPERVMLKLPTTRQFGKVKGLKIITREKTGRFEYSNIYVDLPYPPAIEDHIILDRDKHLAILTSRDTPTDSGARTERKLEGKHVNLLNKLTIYHRVLERKHRRGWHNMTITQGTVTQLIEEDPDWYMLYIAAEKLAMDSYSRVREWETLMVDLICEYADKYWRRQRNHWEHQHMEAVPLTDNHPNYVDEYVLSVDANDEGLIDNVKRLLQQVEDNKAPDWGQLSVLTPPFHAYRPLLYADARHKVEITPLPLNKGEADFVKVLEELVTFKGDFDHLDGKELYLMRNLSRDKGISFFHDHAFYPDFILWMKGAHRQDILFIDPKGLAHYDSKTVSKVDLHTRIKDIEKEIQKQRAHRNLYLHAFIWSHTHPKEIGSDQMMKTAECHERGIYFSYLRVSELDRLLQHALTGHPAARTNAG